ncbi:sirohydrochlorin chelatase [Allokutzneria sp. A3M-2-11 16]|uniref:sirohydrochlorin chelatase n=1 Tax=Allokutzneria sp. A3M-2-11 16 TaxID=2962043 RepID=UPI0020B8C6F1|nr:sirohydrochlorin chelatase [Allokutzneria sp. A3M-2-11 16]MCP3802544.1 sirohydrochlorin chelatase [Allokutzneria sp. A3M-2-11 16]
MTLVLVAHGTRDPAGTRMVERIADAVRERLPKIPVSVAYADVCQPRLSAVLGDLPPGPCVVMPAFLSSGYHVRVDIPAEIAAAQRSDVVVTPALGSEPGIVAAAHDRLLTAGWRPGDAVVFAAAGSSNQAALREVRRAATMLALRLGTPVHQAYVATAQPSVPEVVADLRERGGRIAVASWLLAPGLFHRAITAAEPDLVAAPLGAHPRVVDVIVRRYRSARSYRAAA